MANTKTVNHKNYAKQKTSPAIIITVILAAIVLIGLIVLSLVNKTGAFNEKNIAMKVGDSEVNAIEYAYYYTTVVNNWVDQYQQYLSIFKYDSSKTPKHQTSKYTEDMTWDQFFADLTNNNIKEIKVLAAEAKKAGFKPDQAKIDESVENTRAYLENSAKYYGYSLKNFITLMFNNTKGMTIEKISEYVAEAELATQYGTSISDAIEVSETEIVDYIKENKADFSHATYRFYDYKFTEDEGSADDAKAKAEAHVAAASSEELFEKYVHDILNGDDDEKNDVKDEDEVTLRNNYTVSYIADEKLSGWLLDDARQKGDVTVIEGDGKYTAVYFVELSIDDYKLRDVRHILILGDKDSDDKISDEEYETARVKAQELLDQYNNGKKTEETFAKLATDNTEDPGSKENGGLYEKVYKGEMVEEFEDWVFDETRQTGDTGLVKTSYGYHVMYYVGEGDRYCDVVAENSIKSDRYTKAVDELKANYTTETFDNQIAKIAY